MTDPADRDATADPHPVDPATPAAAGGGAPAKQHGDPLLAASEGQTDGTEGSRQGADATQEARERRD